MNHHHQFKSISIAQIDQKKRKRMESNRESARRSRMRKQKHLDELMSQVNQIKKDNHQLMLNLTLTNQQYLNVETENSILKAQFYELNQRLESLNHIIHFIDTTADLNSSKVGSTRFDNGGNIDYGFSEYDVCVQTDFINHWNNNNMGIMASSDMLQY